MCGRYSLFTPAETLQRELAVDPSPQYRPSYNAAPSQLLPVITNENPSGFSFFYWGLSPQWARNKGISARLINARAETLEEKPSYRQSFRSRRCLVPADGFFEWKAISKKSKIPYRFQLGSAGPFTFAGLWEEFQNDKEQTEHRFTIITTEPNELVSSVHDRMPVIFTSREERRRWLECDDSGELKDLLVSLPAEQMESFPVSPRVNRPQNDDPEVVKPAPPADQHGNLSLFA